ncbi:hypothetical protein HII36_49885 [Nonomuraea sp. NN258]|uniref:hypothetical protein n=1 Tax=Nonomuraea antri TaxID=2730852 RepID=UPI001568FBC2|nr:hypothetical protein [Nonomuraea antri]NRQ39889.1 hypothetical protein [Nonomuraea antri]
MNDLPPSAFIRSAPCKPRSVRVPLGVTLALAAALWISGSSGYAAGLAAQDADHTALRPPAACPVVPAIATSTGTVTPNHPPGQPAPAPQGQSAPASQGQSAGQANLTPQG